MLYYLVNGLSAAYGWFLHAMVGEPRPDPVTEAYAELGAKTWPPVPARGKADTWRAPASPE